MLPGKTVVLPWCSIIIFNFDVYVKCCLLEYKQQPNLPSIKRILEGHSLVHVLYVLVVEL